MSEPKVNGCICQRCADRGVECQRVAEPGEDECRDCRTGRHEQPREQRTAYPFGRWFDYDDPPDPFR